jgi:bacterioferritin-associated ferredoxin
LAAYVHADKWGPHIEVCPDFLSLSADKMDKVLLEEAYHALTICHSTSGYTYDSALVAYQQMYDAKWPNTGVSYRCGRCMAQEILAKALARIDVDRKLPPLYGPVLVEAQASCKGRCLNTDKEFLQNSRELVLMQAWYDANIGEAWARIRRDCGLGTE